jgi:hypothetical protein
MESEKEKKSYGKIEPVGWVQNNANRSTLGIFSSNNIEKGP